MKKTKIKNKKNDDRNFLVDNIFYSKLESRSLSFYKKRYKFQINLSLLYSILIFIFISVGHMNILNKNKKQSTFLTNTIGQTSEYIQTQERKNTIFKTLQHLNNREN
jgi:hypothetical protein